MTRPSKEIKKPPKDQIKIISCMLLLKISENIVKCHWKTKLEMIHEERLRGEGIACCCCWTLLFDAKWVVDNNIRCVTAWDRRSKTKHSGGISRKIEFYWVWIEQNYIYFLKGFGLVWVPMPKTKTDMHFCAPNGTCDLVLFGWFSGISAGNAHP